MALTILPLTSERIDDLSQLFGSQPLTNQCWCMWFIVPVKSFHIAGSAGNRAAFCELLASSDTPIGLLAYQDGEPAGWVAVGPASRYLRALKTPTYRGGEVADVWLVPCFFVRNEFRGTGISQALLHAAVDLAAANGATAIEGFPLASDSRHSSRDLQVGFESLFLACGFEVVRTPSTARRVMRRVLKRQ